MTQLTRIQNGVIPVKCTYKEQSVYKIAVDNQLYTHRANNYV